VTAFAIREAGAADARLLCAMGTRTFLHSFAAPNDPADVAAYMASAYSPELQAAELAADGVVFLIAASGSQPVGYAKLVSGSTAPGVDATRPLQVERFYADVPWIGHGVGGFMMESVIDRATADGHDAIWLAVWEHNTRAIAFYERWGFVIVGRQDFLLGSDLQNDLVMFRSLG
jgi:GNAT superfamily N-acetyltransferase